MTENYQMYHTATVYTDTSTVYVRGKTQKWLHLESNGTCSEHQNLRGVLALPFSTQHSRHTHRRTTIAPFAAV